MDRTGHPGFAILVKLGALIGLSSVLLVNAYGQSRVAFAMSRDGLLPPLFSHLHSRLATPVYGTIALGIVSALGAALLPLSLLSDLISVGVASSFIIVCLCTMWLRSTQPELSRPFRVPLGGVTIGRVWLGWVPMAGILMALTMIVPVVIDLIGQARHGHRAPALILGGYVVLGLMIYFGYGMRRSKLAAATAAARA
jgi:APA family basic amino acid/polyamine antiporter